jgi:predicted DNA-binding transcriptional regulator YafY
MLWAIRDKVDIEVKYQSMRRPNASVRWVAPHAFAYDGHRWHARAWCHETGAFRDFVLTRILTVGATRKSDIDPLLDVDWIESEVVVIEPRSGMTQAQRDSVITDFGMMNASLNITLRRALVHYFIRLLQVDGPNAVNQPIVWANRDQLEHLLNANTLY